MKNYNSNTDSFVRDILDMSTKYETRTPSEIIKELILDEDNLRTLYNPIHNSASYSKETVRRVWEKLTSIPVLKTVIMLSKRHQDELSRNSAVFLYTIATVGSEANNERIDALVELRDNNEVSDEEYRDISMKLESYNDMLKELFSLSNKIVDPIVKDLAFITRLPEKIVAVAVLSTPINIINRNNISMYTINMLRDVYEIVSFNKFTKSPSDVDWVPLFIDIFGEQNIGSVAVAILTENANRINKYISDQNYTEVSLCWESLTSTALDILDKTPENVRNQMIELYIKKLSKHKFKNPRLNILNVPASFANILLSVAKYIDPINALFAQNGIFGKAKDREILHPVDTDKKINPDFEIKGDE